MLPLDRNGSTIKNFAVTGQTTQQMMADADETFEEATKALKTIKAKA